jgi:hypothetical protein
MLRSLPLLLELKETTAPAVAALGEDERAAVDEVVGMLRGNLDKIAEHGKRADGTVRSMLERRAAISSGRAPPLPVAHFIRVKKKGPVQCLGSRVAAGENPSLRPQSNATTSRSWWV